MSANLWTLGRWRFAFFCKMQPGLKPTSFMTLDAALKRRSSTVLRAFRELFQRYCLHFVSFSRSRETPYFDEFAEPLFPTEVRGGS